MNYIDEDDLRAEGDDDEDAFNVGGVNTSGTINVLLGGISVRMLIDSGASTNVIDKGTWKELKFQKIKCISRKCEKKLYAYGGILPLKFIDCFEARVVLGERVCGTEIVVIEGKGQPSERGPG